MVTSVSVFLRFLLQREPIRSFKRIYIEIVANFFTLSEKMFREITVSTLLMYLLLKFSLCLCFFNDLQVTFFSV